MELVGLDSSDPRPPQQPASEEERAAIAKIFETADLVATV
jgi:dihydrodipicolinate synthase/N-acetylneuraminate lyase